VGEDGKFGLRWGGWQKRALIALGIFCGLVVVFHRPLLLSAGHALAVHFAANENLKIAFRLEGSVFTNLTIRNLHAVPTGPSAVESIDVDLLHVDYSLVALVRHGVSEGIKNVDLRSAQLVFNPAKAPLKPKPPNPKEKVKLPDVFPGRVRLDNVNLVVRDQPHDLVIEQLVLSLDPHSQGELDMARLQLVGGQTWQHVTAKTTYAKRDLLLQNLVLSDGEEIRSLHLDGSQLAEKKQLKVSFDYPVAPGNLSGSILLHEAKSSLDLTLRLQGAHLPAGFINKYVGLPENAIGGEIGKVDLDLTGLVGSPASWTGAGVAQLSNFHQVGFSFDTAVFEFGARNGVAALQSGQITQGQNQVKLDGSIELPENIDDLGRARATLQIMANVPDLKEVAAGLPNKLTGSAQLSGKLAVRDAVLTGEFDLNASSLNSAQGAIGKVAGAITIKKKLPAPNSTAPWFADLATTATLDITDLRSHEYAIDATQAVLHSRDDLLTIDHAIVRRKQNEFAVTGDYRLPADFGKAAQQSARINVSLKAPQLGDYWATASPDRVTGPLQLEGQVFLKDGEASGQLWIYGADIRARDLVIHQLSGQCTVARNVVYLNDFTAGLNQQDFVNATASVELRPPFHYRGRLAVNIADLSALRPLLGPAGKDRPLAGSFIMNWEGAGEAKAFKNSGKLDLALTNGRFGTMQSLQANISATYSPQFLDVPTIFFRSDKMDFQAIAHAEGQTMEITRIQLDQGQAKYASGYISIPLVWANLGTSASPLAANGKVAVTFQSENLDLKKLFDDFGMKPPVSGSMNVKVDAHGTLATLDSRFDLQMRDLRSTAVPKFEPASFDLTATTQNGQLNVIGKLQQAKIQPLELSANLPFDAVAIARAGTLPDDTPVTAKVRLPRSSVNFIRQFVPDLAQLDGDVGLDMDVRGTVGKPELSGTGDITINVARTINPTFPAVNNFKGRLNFAHDALTIQQFDGELSGGKFSVSGGIRLAKLTQPIIDLSIKSESALVARDDTMTVRADTDVKISGPLNSATVTGTVATTNSQILKNIDLLPIGLPGRPPPQAAPDRPDISFPNPPLRDWKFDVALKTKDAFRIRGNMAGGGAVADLHLIGTGLHPGIEGMVRLENLEATLPFSRLEVSYGYLSFDPSDSFNPKIELHGTSVIRDYTIHVYVYGTALAPEAVFTSEPPLPQEEVISLLATGATREELTGNNSVLAGRAATLLVQQLYHKIFKKSGGETQNSSIFNRLDVDFGQTDPRTGQRQATARFKVNDQFVLLGDLEVTGGFKGMVKYLIRFH
jgi:hypothetical protein